VNVVVGLGANLGDRLGTLRAAVRDLRLVARVAATSHVYETAPVGPPQPHYLNAAVLLDWAGPPADLLAALLAIEKGLGRTRGGERFGPRTIDLDVLWIDGVVVDVPGLTVPHPRLHERAFALAPMLELVPDARDPATGEPYAVPPGDVKRLEAVV
jgi:2-amino-4-hydroxy-6-hydroxymethyldihydropteridine diphosphokinase